MSAFGALLIEQRHPFERWGFGVQGSEVGLRPRCGSAPWRLCVLFSLFIDALQQFFLRSAVWTACPTAKFANSPYAVCRMPSPEYNVCVNADDIVGRNRHLGLMRAIELVSSHDTQEPATEACIP